MSVDDKFSKSFKSYLGEDAVYNFIDTMKYRGSAQTDCNINVILNHKIPAVFHNLKNYDSHFIIQELGKFNLKINFIPN